jgi:hypothetical protein
MPKHDFSFDICESGDNTIINIASGYDPEINLSINHITNWWLVLGRESNGDYFLDVQVGNHNAVIFEADRDGCRGVDEDRLEIKPIGKYRVDLLLRAVSYIKNYETTIVYALEALYRTNGAVSIGEYSL